jgi:hypothetical protein
MLVAAGTGGRPSLRVVLSLSLLEENHWERPTVLIAAGTESNA